jgi:hypothetical protein
LGRELSKNNFFYFFIILVDRTTHVLFIVQVFEISFPGDFREGVTPVPIPNTEVKPFIADGTA